MKLWTIQGKIVCDRLCADGYYVCDHKLSAEEHEWLGNAQEWLAREMVARIGAGETARPIWARRVRPDLRYYRHNWGDFGNNYVLLELEVDDSRVVLSNEDEFNTVIDGRYVPNDDEELDDLYAIDEALEAMEPAAAQAVIERSWLRILDEEHTSGANNVQVTFWRINKEDVKSVKHFISRSKKDDAQVAAVA